MGEAEIVCLSADIKHQLTVGDGVPDIPSFRFEFHGGRGNPSPTGVTAHHVCLLTGNIRSIPQSPTHNSKDGYRFGNRLFAIQFTFLNDYGLGEYS